MKKQQMKPHYYVKVTEECPVCGGGKTYKYRVYGKKPKDYSKTHEYIQSYDWCLEWGGLM